MVESIYNVLSSGWGLLFGMVMLPVLAGLVVLFVKKKGAVRTAVLFAAAVLGAVFACVLFIKGETAAMLPLAFDFEMDFLVTKLSSVFLLFTSVAYIPAVVFAARSLAGRKKAGRYLCLMQISYGMLVGGLMADSLGILLFFWEGMLATVFAILLIGNSENPRAAVKALTLCGVSDLLIMLGIVLTGTAAGTVNISQMHHLPMDGIAGAGFVCMLLGAAGKMGGMPFHSWYKTAADDSPVPVLAVMAGFIQKIAGLYLVVRLTVDIFAVDPGSAASLFVMIFGAVSLVFGSLLAVAQRDFKQILSYSLVAQAGYALMGLGSGTAAGALGGTVQLLCQTIFGLGLFVAAAIIEKAAGTTDLATFSSLPKKKIIGLLLGLGLFSAVGFPLTDGFFSGAAIFAGVIKSAPALAVFLAIGVFLMAVGQFLPLRALLAKGAQPGRKQKGKGQKVSAGAMLGLGLCAAVGWAAAVPIKSALAPYIGDSLPLEYIEMLPLGILVLAVALAAVYSLLPKGGAAAPAQKISALPGIKSFVNLANAGLLDPYGGLMWCVNQFSAACQKIENGVSWVYDVAVPSAVKRVGDLLSRFDDGSLSLYLLLAICGMCGIGIVFLIVIM